jgi:hypothetical protein
MTIHRQTLDRQTLDTTNSGHDKPWTRQTLDAIEFMLRARQCILLQNFFTFSRIFSLCCTLIFHLFHRRQVLNYMERTAIKSSVRAWVIVLGLG